MKISERFSLPSMCLMSTNFCWIASRDAFSRIWMWRIARDVVFLFHWTHAWLSLYMMVDLESSEDSRFKSLMMCEMRRMSLTHSSVAYISASPVLRAVIFWRFADQ